MYIRKTMSTNANKSSASMYSVSMKTLRSLGTVPRVLLIVFIILVIGIVVYWIYNAIQRAMYGDTMNPILVSGSINASDPSNSLSWKLPTSAGSNSSSMSFTLSFWMYIADWQYRIDEPKAILIKGLPHGRSVAPGIWLAPTKNNLLVATSVLGKNKAQLCDVANIPIQKWVHVAYVLNNRVVDVYINSKLERSCVLDNVPRLNNHKLYLFPKNSSSSIPGVRNNETGYLGQLSSLRYFSKALTPSDVHSMYQRGPHYTTRANSKSPDKRPDAPDPGMCPGEIDYEKMLQVQKELQMASGNIDTILNDRNRYEAIMAEKKNQV